ncbi:MAG: hypothetical protein ACYCWW_02115 [Deltaproteobacteria bacterium]
MMLAFAACGKGGTGGTTGGATSGNTGGATSGNGSGGTTGGTSAGTGLIAVTGASATVLVVDNDGSDNNSGASSPTPSPSDTLFTSLSSANHLAYNLYVVPTGATTVPAAGDLASYQAVIWYTGPVYGNEATMTAAQEQVLEGWLDQGGKTLILYSENLVFDLSSGGNGWAGPEQDALLSQYVGATGDASDVNSSAGTLDHGNYVATGAGPLAGMTFHVTKDTPILSTADVINPKSGIDTLATVVADPDGTVDQTVASAVGNKAAGAKKSSKVVWVGMPIEDFLVVAGGNTNSEFFAGVLAYVGL